MIRIGRHFLRHLASDPIRIALQFLPFSNVLAVAAMMACTSVASWKENDAY